MNDAIEYRGFFGEGPQTFALTDDMITELERKTGKGIAAIHRQILGMEFSAEVLREIIRLGMIGAGMTPEKAMQLCATYATNRPVAELFPLAFEILEARWTGTEGGETAEDVERNVQADWDRFAANLDAQVTA